MALVNHSLSYTCHRQSPPNIAHIFRSLLVSINKIISFANLIQKTFVQDYQQLYTLLPLCFINILMHSIPRWNLVIIWNLYTWHFDYRQVQTQHYFSSCKFWVLTSDALIIQQNNVIALFHHKTVIFWCHISHCLKFNDFSWSSTIHFYDVLMNCYIIPQKMTVK